jgi:helicase required for RNAi-mediated heterochromatin assembly 1
VPYAPVKDIDQDETPDDVEIFCPGTLVVLSSDRFKSTCFVATVVKNEGLRDSPPTIDLLWAKQDYVVTDCTLELVMLEPTSGYFESLRYTMLGLQKMAKTRYGQQLHCADAK